MTSFLAFILLLAQAFLPFPGPGRAPVGGSSTSTLISHTCQGLGTNGGTTTSISTSGANFVVLATTSFITIPNTDVSDNKSNGNPTALASFGPSGSGGTPLHRIFYWTNPTVGTGHTFTIATSGSYSSVCVESWSNMATSSVFDSGGTNTNDGGSVSSGTTCFTGVVTTPTSGAKIVISGIAYNTTGTASIDSGMNVDDNVLIGGASNYAASIASVYQATGTAIQPIWTLGTTDGKSCSTGVFRGN